MTTDQQRRRLFDAKRAGAKARLTGDGMSVELAERWLAAWEASSNMDAEQHSSDFWERAWAWASSAAAARQKPPRIEG
jgi:truncated hemoglobin YjbI